MRLIATGVIAAWLAAGCGDGESRDMTDGSAEARLVTLVADPALDLVGEPVYAHWSEAGNERGERVAIGTWEGGAAELTFPLEGIASVPSQRLDLAAAGTGEGTFSIAWLEVGDAPIATANADVLLELTADASADSLVGNLLGEPVPAGVHVLNVREFTAEEMAAHDACVAAASDPDRECPTLRHHVSVDHTSTVELVEGDQRPDLG